MNDVAALNVSATETGVSKVDKALIGLAASAGKAEAATGRFTSAQMKAAQTAMAGWDGFNAVAAKQPALVKAAGVQMQNYGMHTANVFSQLNDIGMMMAAGQNPLQLALQQGTQLNQVWGQVGGNIGSVGALIKGAFMSLLNPLNLVTIGVIAGGAALVNYFTAGEEKARSFDDAINDVWSSVDKLQQQQNTYSIDGVQSLIEKYGELNAEVLRLIDNQTIVAQRQAFEDVRASMQAMKEETAGWINDFTGLQDIFPNIAGQVNHLQWAMEGAVNATNFDDQLVSVTALRSKIEEVTGGVGHMTAAQFEFYKKVLDSEDALRQLTKASPGPGWMGSAIKETNLLIGRLIAANNIARQLSVTATASVGIPGEPPKLGYSGGVGSMDLSAAFSGGSGGSSGGSSGGGSDPYQANLDRLMTSLMTERETVEKWHADNELILNDRRAKEQLGEAAHKEAMLDLERQYQEKIKNLKDEGASTYLNDTSKFFGDLNSLAGGGYDGLMRAQKSFAAASALVNTYLAASQALADPKISTFAKFVAVAKVVAAGMGLVNAIKGGSKSSAGGGSGGGSSNAPTTAGTAAVEPTRTTTVNFQGDPFMIAIAESVMSQMYDASGNGRVLIKA